jgi:hypothetical protein
VASYLGGCFQLNILYEPAIVLYEISKIGQDISRHAVVILCRSTVLQIFGQNYLLRRSEGTRDEGRRDVDEMNIYYRQNMPGTRQAVEEKLLGRGHNVSNEYIRLYIPHFFSNIIPISEEH